MEFEDKFSIKNWRVEKIAVVGAGIVGIPMAAVLARARICQGSDNPSRVVVIQRNSPTSGWKVNAISAGKSPIGGIEPDLDRIVANVVQKGLLSASHDYSELSDADIILVCVQTDKQGFSPDYEPMFEALARIAPIIQKKHTENVPLIVIESTLAPSSMLTLIREQFAQYGLEDGRDILLGHSPNRVMPGHLVERIISSDKIIGGLNPVTPKFIQTLYSKIVTKGDLYLTNCMTAEIVKTLENAYRDVRIAFTAEIGRYCDAHDIDFYFVRERVNNRLAWSDIASENPNAVPTGGLLIPTIGVGGHCLPKDGVLLLWRQIEAGGDMSKSLILEARRINDESPNETVLLAERHFGNLSGQSISLMGTAYRFNSEDTRNSPTLALAKLLLQKGCNVIVHDPFVKTDDQNLLRFDLQKNFTQDLNRALEDSDFLIFCTAHKIYQDEIDHIMRSSESLKGIFDGCNLFSPDLTGKKPKFSGIGKGKNPPKDELIDFVYESFRAVEQGFANEIQRFIDFANERYAMDDFNRVDFSEVQLIAGTCITGCQLVDPGPIIRTPDSVGLSSRLVKCAE
jgi:UDP-N-acetyl-D-mannosaminuronic acid dehydrogenase